MSRSHRRGGGGHRRGGPADHEPFAGVRDASLIVHGWSATIHRVHGEADEGAELVSLVVGDETEQVERHDARLLLDPVALAPRPWKRARSAEAEALAQEEAALDEERYRDLYNKEAAAASGGDEPGEASPARRTSSAGQGFAAVPFSYGGEEPAAAEAAAAAEAVEQAAASTALPVPGPDEPRFVPRFSLPASLRRAGAAPATRRHYAVLLRTAEFVRRGGGQAEVLLRVKQAGNIMFAFLLQDDPLHEFYRWLVDADPAALVEVDSAPGREEPPAARQPPATAAPQQQQQEAADEADEGGGAAAAAGGDAFALELDSLALLGQQYGDENDALDNESEAQRQEQEQQLAADLRSLAIMRALVLRLHSGGRAFASVLRQRHGDDPDFAFAKPGGRHNKAYALALVDALGQEAAEGILADAAVAAGGGAVQHGTEGGAELSGDAGNLHTAAGLGAAGDEHAPSDVDQAPGQDEPSPPAADAAQAAADAEADEARKAERRRKARELLRQRQEAARVAQAEAVRAAAEERRRQLSAISVHKRAFLGASDDEDVE